MPPNSKSGHPTKQHSLLAASPIATKKTLASGWIPPVLSTRSILFRKPAVAERHSSSAHRVQRWNESSHRHMKSEVGLAFHSRNRRRRGICSSYALGSAWTTILVFGRARRLQTADINSRPPLGLTRFRHNRIDSGSSLARYNSHCISRNCSFNESTVRSKSTSRSAPNDLLAVSIISLPSFHKTVQ
jgi:hypothetical protein